jgi:hypothetical protein
LFVDVVEVDDYWDVLVEGDVNEPLEVFLEICHLLLNVVIDEVDKIDDAEIG